MKKIKKANESQFWQVIGLLALAKKHYKQMEYIQEAIGDTLGIDDTTGHIGDMVWQDKAFGTTDYSSLSTKELENLADWWLNKVSTERQTLREKIEGIRKSAKDLSNPMTFEIDITYKEERAFNQALDSVIALIDKKND